MQKKNNLQIIYLILFLIVLIFNLKNTILSINTFNVGFNSGIANYFDLYYFYTDNLTARSLIGTLINYIDEKQKIELINFYHFFVLLILTSTVFLIFKNNSKVFFLYLVSPFSILTAVVLNILVYRRENIYLIFFICLNLFYNTNFYKKLSTINNFKLILDILIIKSLSFFLILIHEGFLFYGITFVLFVFFVNNFKNYKKKILLTITFTTYIFNFGLFLFLTSNYDTININQIFENISYYEKNLLLNAEYQPYLDYAKSSLENLEMPISNLLLVLKETSLINILIIVYFTLFINLFVSTYCKLNYERIIKMNILLLFLFLPYFILMLIAVDWGRWYFLFFNSTIFLFMFNKDNIFDFFKKFKINNKSFKFKNKQHLTVNLNKIDYLIFLILNYLFFLNSSWFVSIENIFINF